MPLNNDTSEAPPAKPTLRSRQGITEAPEAQKPVSDQDGRIGQSNHPDVRRAAQRDLAPLTSTDSAPAIGVGMRMTGHFVTHDSTYPPPHVSTN